MFMCANSRIAAAVAVTYTFFVIASSSSTKQKRAGLYLVETEQFKKVGSSVNCVLTAKYLERK